MSRIVAIVNPAAGGGRALRRAEPLLAGLEGLEVRRTEGPGHATALARAAVDARADVVVAVGGDGTVCEVVNGLSPGNGPALGVLPLGTGNSFVRDVGLAAPEAAAAAIRAGRTRPVDLLRLDHADGTVFSINLVSLGFSAEAGALTNRAYKPFGAMGYVLAVLQSLVRLRYHAFPIALDDGGFDGRPVTLLSFCNSRYTGGDMLMAPAADPSDGEVDVVRIGTMRRRRFLASFPRIFRGTHPSMPEVETRRARRVVFASVGPVDVMIDGEVRTLEPRRLEVVPRALQVLA